MHLLSGEYDWSGTAELGLEAHRAIAGSTFAEMNDRAISISEELNFDMAWTVEKALEIDRIVGERCLRLGMRGVWLYLLCGMLVAISVTVPIFLINRERVLSQREPSSTAGDFTDPVASLPNVYGTHHIGASTDQAQAAIAEETVRIVSTFKETGRVPNVVNLARRSPATHMLVVRHRDRVIADTKKRRVARSPRYARCPQDVFPILR